jgi:transcriptional regulator with XRE-family HTH domain
MRPKITNTSLAAFGQSMRAYRTASGLTQEDLADLANLDRSYVGGVERGERNLTLLNLLTIAKALNAAPSQLLAVFDNTYNKPKTKP